MTLFTSEISAFASVHRQRRAARDYIIACFCFNANDTSLNGICSSAFKTLIIFCRQSQWTCLVWFSAHSEREKTAEIEQN